MNNDFDYQRRSTVTVQVGNVPLGGDHPVRVQSMTNTSTNDIELSAAQCQRIAEAGAHFVRLTAQGVREAENMGRIGQLLRGRGYDIPLIADIHFNPKAALTAAATCQKVRINPGNFVDPARQFKQVDYTDEEYRAELLRIHDALVPLLQVCKEHHTALRLGVNHGSLSDRIMSRYGNTAAGMVESVMEFLRVCVEQRFDQVVVSMKASNVVVMVEAVRRIVAAMDAENMHFPLHLGVTEAGFGEDGRIKSAVGIGTLLAEGLGDTVRVSLSEEPESEVPVAQKLVDYIAQRTAHDHIEGHLSKGYDRLMPQRRHSIPVTGRIGGDKPPVVVASCRPQDLQGDLHPDYYYSPDGNIDGDHEFIVPLDRWDNSRHSHPFITLGEWNRCPETPLRFLQVPASVSASRLEFLRGRTDVVLVVTPASVNVPGSEMALLHGLIDAGITCPVVVRNLYDDNDREQLQMKAGADLGALLLAGFDDGIWLEAPNVRNADLIVGYSFAILQAARQRITHTEFISCPGCGRTMFDLQSTVRRVQEATAHLTHLKIGVMGCVVNGPGEMADADYGYVGAAPQRISLYKGKQCVEKNLPQDEAIEHLIALIRANGDWSDPD